MGTDHELQEGLRDAMLRISWLQPFLGSVGLKVERGEVTVDGRVPADSLKGLILRLIGSTPGVMGIKDHLIIEETHPRVGVQIDWAHRTIAVS